MPALVWSVLGLLVSHHLQYSSCRNIFNNALWKNNISDTVGRHTKLHIRLHNELMLRWRVFIFPNYKTCKFYY